MSYLLYINGFEMELESGLSIAQTKQVNDIANITTRQSNFTQSIKLPKTAKNTNILQKVGLVGNQSNVPYQKNNAVLIDTDTGQHLIYNGWAVLVETSDKYNITVYDGSIDFFRAIENITITDCGISELNHIKSLTNIIATWTDLTIPYRYIVADYNGNNSFDGKLNIDYQVPSASVQFIWDRIFNFIGFTYEGSIFNHEDFQNLWLTFPKPTGELEPNRILINKQESSDVPYTFYVQQSNALLSYQAFNIDIFRENFSEIEANLTNTNQWTTVTTPTTYSVPQRSFITITETGVYSIKLTGGGGNTFRLFQFNNINEFIGQFDFTAEVIFNATVGDKIECIVVPPSGSIYANDPSGFATQPFTAIGSPNLDALEIEFNRIDGYAVNFEEIFIDFKVTDFLKEILVRFGLTPFKDKYSNKVTFLTLYELLQNPDVNNYSSKFIRKISEKYTFGNYAKRNLFKYKYNDEGFKHNDGYIQIDNDNLNDEVTIIQSKIYSPESKKSNFYTHQSNVYKIWEKEIKDDSTVEYKDLEGRFYFQRSERINSPLPLISELTNITDTATFYYRENYFRLGYQNILNDWYRPIASIFNKAKLLTVECWLKPFEIANFDFSKLIYIEQLSSYYLVNKVVNFVKNKPTKLELIEVDYFSEIEGIVTPVYEIIPDTPSVVDCELVIPVTTNIEQPANCFLVVFAFSGFGFSPVNLLEPISGVISGDVATFPLNTLPASPIGGYQFQVGVFPGTFEVLFSVNTTAIDIDGSCFDAPDVPTEVTIDSIDFLGEFFIMPYTYRNWQINYSYDEVPAAYVVFVEGFYIDLWVSVGEINKTSTQPNNVQVQTSNWISKLRITINGVTSNEITL